MGQGRRKGSAVATDEVAPLGARMEDEQGRFGATVSACVILRP